MNRGKIALLVVAALVFLSLGFVIGQVVQAVDTLPGSNEDPIATQSYVETAVGERLAVLNTKIEELEAEVAALKQIPIPMITIQLMFQVAILRAHKLRLPVIPLM